MPPIWRMFACGLLAAWSAAAVSQGAADRDAVPGSLTGKPGDASNGRAVVLGRQSGFCLLCHSGPFPEERHQGNLAPDLRHSVSGLSAAQIRLRLIDPSRTNPDTIMPAYFRSDHLVRVAERYQGRSILSAQEIEDVLAFLLTLRTP
jgi:sulfur-oxidizing protein SoxX